MEGLCYSGFIANVKHANLLLLINALSPVYTEWSVKLMFKHYQSSSKLVGETATGKKNPISSVEI